MGREWFEGGLTVIEEPHRRADEFVDLFVRLEQALGDITRDKEPQPFGDLVGKASELNKAVAFHESFLRSAARLRNSLVHQPRQEGRLIADPRHDFVEDFRSALEDITRPPALLPEFARNVVMAASSDPIRSATLKMLEGAFSQLPVYDGRLFVELLTAETITRWLASTDFSSDLANTSISDVLEFTEDSEHFSFLRHDASVFDALSCFDDFASRGKYLDAILVTRNGKRCTTPDAIITTFDIPVLREMIIQK